MALKTGYYKLTYHYGLSEGESRASQDFYTFLAVTESRSLPVQGQFYFFQGTNSFPDNIALFKSVYPESPVIYDYVFKTGDADTAKYADGVQTIINYAGQCGINTSFPSAPVYWTSGNIYYYVEFNGNVVYNGRFQPSGSSVGTSPIFSRSTTGNKSDLYAYMFYFNYVTSSDTMYSDQFYMNAEGDYTPPRPYIRLSPSIATEMIEIFDGAEPIIPPWLDTDPYGPGGTSGTGGGTGTFSDTGDMIGVPSLPTLSAVDTGFITLFNPTAAQVKALANYMWSSGFDLATFKNIVANPIDCILGLTIVPVDPPNAGTKVLTVGNIATDVSMPYLSSQYVEVDCGTLDIVEFWGSYLDYSPYTKISLYLPYIGIVPVDIDDMQNTTVHVVYHVDVLSGACVAYVLCGGTQLYTYIGQCSSNVPITSNDFTNTVNGILSIAGAVGSLVASEGATAPQAIGTVASAAVNALKPNIQKSGSLSGTGGMLGVQTPYLICQRPRQSVPTRQNHFTGYPSNITYTLSDLSGYTEVQDIHLDNVPCTDNEVNEILEYLTGGVVI